MIVIFLCEFHHNQKAWTNFSYNSKYEMIPEYFRWELPKKRQYEFLRDSDFQYFISKHW